MYLIEYLLMEFLVFAIGNEFRGDDGAGIYAGKLMKKKGFPVIFCGNVPENYLDKAKDAKRIILIDAAIIDEDFVVTKDLADFKSISTHSANLKILKDYLEKSGKEVIFIGIKPEEIGYGNKISRKVKERCKKLVDHIEDLINCIAKSERGFG